MLTAYHLRALLLAAVLQCLYLPGYAQKQPEAQSLPASVQLSPGVVVVTYQDGELTIQALNAPLTRVLRAASLRMGTIIDLPSGTDEAVVGQFGPGRPAAVIAALLNGSRFNYVMTASVADPNRLERVVLTVRPDAVENSSPQKAQESIPAAASNVEVVSSVSVRNDSVGLLSPEQLRSQVNELLAQAGAEQADVENLDDGSGMQQLQSVMEATLARATALAAIDKAIEEHTSKSSTESISTPAGQELPTSRMKRRRR